MGKITRFWSSAETVRVDKIDRKLLQQITRDARKPLAHIAREFRIARDTAAYRVARLERLGVLSHFFPNVSYTRLGCAVYHVFFLLDEREPKQKQAFLEYLLRNDCVGNIVEYSDRWDFGVSVLADSPGDFDEWFVEITSLFRTLILDRIIFSVLRRYNQAFYPAIDEPYLEHGASVVQLDLTDKQILSALARDGRASAYTLARQLGISPDTIRYRMHRLEERKVILNHAGAVNLARLGFHWHTFSMKLRTFDRQQEAKFEEMLRQHPNIFSAVKTLGAGDILIYAASPELHAFHLTIQDLKRGFSDVILGYEAWLVRKEHLYNPLPGVLLR